MSEEYKFPVRVDWNNQRNQWWNETCASVLEVFGLPGHRFIFKPEAEHMTFSFKNEQDQLLCQTLLSERI